jgi:hypothetical protein
MATYREGKPYGLKGQIYQGLRAARPILRGWLIDPASDGGTREMIEQDRIPLTGLLIHVLKLCANQE